MVTIHTITNHGSKKGHLNIKNTFGMRPYEHIKDIAISAKTNRYDINFTIFALTTTHCPF